MSSIYDVDPTAIRVKLQRSRSQDVPFIEAWGAATVGVRRVEGDASLYQFMRRNFEAAYHDDESDRGRCLVPERDTSEAVPAVDFTARRETATLVGLPVARREHERCRSGDGCDRLATRGRFGQSFCEHHGAELERLSGLFRQESGDRDPRRSKNDSAFKRRQQQAA